MTTDYERIRMALGHATDTVAFLAESGALEKTAETLNMFFEAPKRVALIADGNTYEAAGRRVAGLLAGAGTAVDEFIFPAEPLLHADYERSVEVVEWLRRRDAVPVAVGSGTINDIVKVAAYECGRPYLVVATAASVDGYTSHGAAMSRSGFKNTIPCKAPKVVIADTDVISRAPKPMAAAGYADLLAKVPAGADWLLADELGIEAVDPVAWDMVQGSLREWVAEPDKVRAGDPEAYRALMEGLTFTGFAMQYAKKSRPASGSEHLISHVWEMEGLELDGKPVAHGFKVGIGSILSTALMECVLRRGFTEADLAARRKSWPSWNRRAAEVERVYAGTPMLDQILGESRAKHLDAEGLDRRYRDFTASWPRLCALFSEQLIPAPELKEMLERARCPVTLGEIGVSAERARSAVITAQMIRNRYGILDMAYELGILEECTDAVLDTGIVG